MNDNIVQFTKDQETPREMLERVIVEHESQVHPNLVNAKKALVVFLDDTNGAYSISTYTAGLKVSELLSLIEVVKTSALIQMGYLKEGGDGE